MTWSPIVQSTRKSLLAMIKQASDITPRFLSKLINSVVFKSELPDFVETGGVDHGLAAGLTDDDHTQYYNKSRHEALSHSFVDHDDLTNVGTYDHSDIDDHIDDATIHFTEGSIDHGSISGLGDDDHLQYLLRSEWKQNGFVDYVNEVDFAWVDGTRTLTISPSVTSFQYYYDGVLYTETGSLAATITDTEGDWLFYIGSGGAASLSTIHNPSYAQVEDAIRNECLVAYVYWDAANSDGRLLLETHGAWMSPETHHYLHETLGSQYIYGFAIGDITADESGNTDSHAQFSITAGQFYDEDLGHNLLARSSTDTWEAFYVDGSGYVRWTDCEATFPVVAIGGVIAYNNAGTLTAVSNNKYCLYHVYATNVHTDSGGDYYPVVVPGTAEYNSKSDAQDAALSEIQLIDWGEWPTEELIPLWSVIYHHGAAMTNGVEAAIQSTDGGGDAVDWRFSATRGSEHTVNDHGALSGLSDDDHAQYLLASAATDRATFATNWTDLTDTGDTTLHGHDVTGLTNWGGPYLPLTAGSGSPLTGDLYIYDGTVQSSMKSVSSRITLGWRSSALNVVSEINFGNDRPVFITGTLSPLSVTSEDFVLESDLDDYLPLTAGSGKPLTGDLEIEDGSSNTQHNLASVSGDVDLCQQGGGLKVSNGYVQLPYLASAPAIPANGMIWMESDGLHLYYAGAEKVVAGA